MSYYAGEYDCIVVGAGHAGCEAALAAARMGCDTLLLTISRDQIALMPCNPSIGGPAKGVIVREIDALGGEMGINADATALQAKTLNTGKGPAVYALRVQSDRYAYQRRMIRVLDHQERTFSSAKYGSKAAFGWGRKTLWCRGLRQEVNIVPGL